MKVKAKIVLNYCRCLQDKCEYIIDTLGEDFMYECDKYMKHGDSCIHYQTKEIYIDKEYKEASIEYAEVGNEIYLHIGRKTYANDGNIEIEYLYIDDKPIVENYQVIREKGE